jgi:hypothetical protein
MGIGPRQGVWRIRAARIWLYGLFALGLLALLHPNGPVASQETSTVAALRNTGRSQIVLARGPLRGIGHPRGRDPRHSPPAAGSWCGLVRAGGWAALFAARKGVSNASFGPIRRANHELVSDCLGAVSLQRPCGSGRHWNGNSTLRPFHLRAALRSETRPLAMLRVTIQHHFRLGVIAWRSIVT